MAKKKKSTRKATSATPAMQKAATQGAEQALETFEQEEDTAALIVHGDDGDIDPDNEPDDDDFGDPDAAHDDFTTGGEDDEEVAPDFNEKEDIFSRAKHMVEKERKVITFQVRKNSKRYLTVDYPYSWSQLQREHGPGHYSIIAQDQYGKIVGKEADTLDEPKNQSGNGRGGQQPSAPAQDPTMTFFRMMKQEQREAKSDANAQANQTVQLVSAFATALAGGRGGGGGDQMIEMLKMQIDNQNRMIERLESKIEGQGTPQAVDPFAQFTQMLTAMNAMQGNDDKAFGRYKMLMEMAKMESEERMSFMTQLQDSSGGGSDSGESSMAEKIVDMLLPLAKRLQPDTAAPAMLPGGVRPTAPSNMPMLRKPSAGEGRARPFRSEGQAGSVRPTGQAGSAVHGGQAAPQPGQTGNQSAGENKKDRQMGAHGGPVGEGNKKAPMTFESGLPAVRKKPASTQAEPVVMPAEEPRNAREDMTAETTQEFRQPVKDIYEQAKKPEVHPLYTRSPRSPEERAQLQQAVIQVIGPYLKGWLFPIRKDSKECAAITVALFEERGLNARVAMWAFPSAQDLLAFIREASIPDSYDPWFNNYYAAIKAIVDNQASAS